MNFGWLWAGSEIDTQTALSLQEGTLNYSGCNFQHNMIWVHSSLREHYMQGGMLGQMLRGCNIPACDRSSGKRCVCCCV